MPASPATTHRRPQRLRKNVSKPEYLVTAAPPATKASPKKKATKTKKAPAPKKKVQPEVYSIEKVLEVKRVGTGSRISCLIKWEGYEETTWEPISYLNEKAKKDAKELLEKLEPKEEEKKTKKGLHGVLCTHSFILIREYTRSITKNRHHHPHVVWKVQ